MAEKTPNKGLKGIEKERCQELCGILLIHCRVCHKYTLDLWVSERIRAEPPQRSSILSCFSLLQDTLLDITWSCLPEIPITDVNIPHNHGMQSWRFKRNSCIYQKKTCIDFCYRVKWEKGTLQVSGSSLDPLLWSLSGCFSKCTSRHLLRAVHLWMRWGKMSRVRSAHIPPATFREMELNLFTSLNGCNLRKMWVLVFFFFV